MSELLDPGYVLCVCDPLKFGLRARVCIDEKAALSKAAMAELRLRFKLHDVGGYFFRKLLSGEGHLEPICVIFETGIRITMKMQGNQASKKPLNIGPNQLIWN